MSILTKQLLYLLLFLLSNNIFPQVGIGTTTPNSDALLDVDASSSNGGILLPRLGLLDTSLPAPLSTDVAGMIVYNTATAGDVTPGFYYNDGAVWVRLGAGGAPSNDWTLAGNGGTTYGTDFVGTTDGTDLAIARNSITKIRVENDVSTFANEIRTRDGSTDSGDILTRIYDSNDDGIIAIYRNNRVQHRLHGNGTTVFNERSANVDFRIESNTATDGFFLEGSDGQVTIGNYGTGAITAGAATQMLAVDANGNIVEEALPGAATAWDITGNNGLDGGNTTTNGTNFIGTTDAENIEFRTNNIQRARLSSLGEFFVGTINTVIAGDLMNAVGNATFPWAVNGYTSENGGGVYGSIQAGTTNFAAVQGEYVGTGSSGAGVRGSYMTNTAGTDFATVPAGVTGDGTTSGSYKFGIYGSGGTSRRSGGVMGYNYGVAMGALGYYANNWNDYAVYGFGQGHTTGGAGGRSSSEVDTFIGLGIYGGVVGGWIKGKEYGSISSGKRFANYSLGKTITNESFIVLDKKQDGSKSISYASTSMSVDIQDKGLSKLSNGTKYIAFDKNYSEIIDDSKPIIVTITTIGESNGVHLISVDKNGFKIKENNNGNSNVSFNWIAIAEKNTAIKPISREILAANFDSNLNEVMHNDTVDGGKAIWAENDEIKFGKVAPRLKVKDQVDPKKSEVQRFKSKHESK